MTSNQINKQRADQDNAAKLRENATQRKALKEQQRHNKATEHIQKFSAVGKVATDTFGNLVSGAKTIGALANDPAWYNLNKQMVADAASISFKSPLMYGLGTMDLQISNTQSPRGSVVALGVIPSIGIRHSGTIGAPSTPTNFATLCAQNIYAWVRHANSGASNYEPADLMMYLFAMDAAYSFYAWGRSIYRLANSFSGDNLTLIQDISNAINVDVSDFRSNLASFRWYLNSVATRLNALAVPSKFPYFNRHIWMFSNLFKDDNTRKSSIYLFYPEKIGLFEPTSGRIQYQSPSQLLVSGLWEYHEFVSVMDRILSNLLAVEDIGIINGDIRKAYGSDLFMIEETPVDDYIDPIYSAEVLSQISCATLVGTLKNDTCDICQYNGTIYQGTYVESGTPTVSQYYPNISVADGSAYTRRQFIVNLYKDDPTPDDVMVATRLMAEYGYATESQTTHRLVIGTGSEFITTATVVYYGDNTSSSTKTSIYDYVSRFGAGVAAVLYQFDWFPSFIGNPDSAATTTFYTIIPDLSVYALIDDVVLHNIHSTALLSEFYIPTQGLR